MGALDFDQGRTRCDRQTRAEHQAPQPPASMLTSPGAEFLASRQFPKLELVKLQ